MRLRVFVVVLMFVLMVSVVGVAGTFTEILPPIGSQTSFGVYATESYVTIVNGVLDVKLKFNFPNSILEPILDTNASPHITWFPGDLLFYSGSNMYGIPLYAHGDSVLSPLPPDIVTAFNVYKTDTFLTADNLLGTTDVEHRLGNAVVWIGGTPTFLTGPLTHNVSGGSGSPFVVTISGQLPTEFANDVAKSGFTAYFASTECANGYMYAEQDPGGEVPEPASLALFGTGLFGLGMLRHRYPRAK